MGDGDHALVERAVAGDREALAALLERHGPRLARTLRSSIPTRARSVLSIDDVVQDAYTEAFLAIGRFEWRGEGSFLAWLSTLARRSLLDTVRLLEADKRGGRHRRVELDRTIDLAEQLGWTTSTPSRVAARDEAGKLLQTALANLPADYRQAIEAYDLGGRTVEEVAVILDRSPGAVHMLRMRAHRMLAEVLGTESKYFSRSP